MTQIVQSQAATRTTYGMLAAQSGQVLPMQVLRSNAGFYLGTYSEEGPYSRESLEYWRTAAQATEAWTNGHWTQRDHH